MQCCGCFSAPHKLLGIVFALLAVVLPGCAPTGDFGRRQPSFLHDQIVPAARTAIRDIRGKATSQYPLTADEEELRARAHTLVSVDRRKSIDRFLASGVDDLGIVDSRFEENRQIAHNSGKTAYESAPPSRNPYTLRNVVRAQVWQYQEFGDVVERVYRSDARRRATLVRQDDIPTNDIHNATSRIAENRRVVEQTILAMRNRVDNYRLELRRSVLEYPDIIPEGRVTAAIDRLSDLGEILQDQTRIWAFPDDYASSADGAPASRTRAPRLAGG